MGVVLGVMSEARPSSVTVLLVVWLLCVATVNAPGLTVYGRTVSVVDSSALRAGDLALFPPGSPHADSLIAPDALPEPLVRPLVLSATAARRLLSAFIDTAFVFSGGPVALVPNTAAADGQLGFITALAEHLRSWAVGSDVILAVALEQPVPSVPDPSFSDPDTADWSAVLGQRGTTVYYTIGSEGRRRSYRFAVVTFRPVLMALHRIDSGARLAPGQLVTRYAKPSSFSSTVLTPTHDLSAYLTTNTVEQGQAILADSVRLQTTVTRGRRVVITFQGPGLVVSVPGYALASASVGETVVVRTANGSREFRGTVRSEQEVSVDL